MRRLGRLAAFAVAVVAVGATNGCADGKPPTATPGTAPAPPISFTVSGGEVAGVTPPGPGFPDDARAKVMATLERYLSDAVVAPLRSGQPASDMAPLFTGPALARMNGPDRAALVDSPWSPTSPSSSSPWATTAGRATPSRAATPST